MRFLRRMAATLVVGYILMFYSETMFWARFRPGEDSLAGYLMTWIAYSLSSFILLSLISLFRVRTIWSLFLCGALYGWLTEGVIVQTMYDFIPLSISFTGLAWHALISIWVGWYGVRKIMLGNRVDNTLLVASLTGAFWGFWGICWRVEAPATAATSGGFAIFAFATTLLVIPAYWLYDRLIQDTYPPTKIELGIVGALFVLQFAITAVPANFLALIILPPLLLVIFLSLGRNKQAETGDSLVQTLTVHPRLSIYLCLLAMPLVASTIYWLTGIINLQLQTNWVVYFITTPLGAITFLVSLIKVWSRRPLLPASQPSVMPIIARIGGVSLAILVVAGLIGAWRDLTTGLDADAIRPIDALCGISPRPVLLIYGTLEDGSLAPGSAQQMFDAACDPKELWVIEGAGHGGYAYMVPDEYEQRIVRFFEEALQ